MEQFDEPQHQRRQPNSNYVARAAAPLASDSHQRADLSHEEQVAVGVNAGTRQRTGEEVFLHPNLAANPVQALPEEAMSQPAFAQSMEIVAELLDFECRLITHLEQLASTSLPLIPLPAREVSNKPPLSN